MPVHRKLVSIGVAAILGGLLLGWGAWMARDLFKPEPPKEEWHSGDEPHRRHGHYLAEAQLPWTRELSQPQETTLFVARQPWSSTATGSRQSLLVMGALPWGHRRTDRPVHSVSLYPASVPTIHPMREWTRPQPARVNPAEIPWQSTRTGTIYEIPLARVPVLRDARLPEPADVQSAANPWPRDHKAPLPASVPPAEVSSQLKRITPGKQGN